MNMKIEKVKIVVTVPEDATDAVREAVCESGAGVIGNYTYCSTAVKGIGTFMPNSNANPHVGKKEKLEFVSEDRLEFICDVDKVGNVVKKLRSVHPYEEPDIDIYPLLNEESFNEEKDAKVITICGSLKFRDKLMEVSERLELEGNCVISVIYSTSDDKDSLSEEEMATIIKLHKQKIRMCDAIYVVNVGGYIGDSVKKEIAYAKSLNKEIMYLEDIDN